MFWLLLSRVFLLVVPSIDNYCCQVSCVFLFHALYRAVPCLFSDCPKFRQLMLSYVLCLTISCSVFCLGVPSSVSCCPASVLYLALACLVSCYNRFRLFLSRVSYFAAVSCVLLFRVLYPTVPCLVFCCSVSCILRFHVLCFTVPCPVSYSSMSCVLLFRVLYPTVQCLVFCCGRVLFPYSSMSCICCSASCILQFHVSYFAVLTVLGLVFCSSVSCMLLLNVLYFVVLCLLTVPYLVFWCSVSCILKFHIFYFVVPCLVSYCSMSCILMFCVVYLTVPVLYFDALCLVSYCPVPRCSIVTCLLQLMFCLVKIPAFSLAVLRLVPYCPKYCLMLSHVLSHAVPSIVLCCPTSCLFSFVCLLSSVLSVNCKFAFWSLPLDILFPFGSFFFFFFFFFFFLSSVSAELRWMRYFTPSVSFLVIVIVVDLTSAVLSDLFWSSCAKIYTSLKTTLHTITSSLPINSIIVPPSSQHYCPVVFTTLLHRPPTLHSTVFLTASIYSE